MLELIGIVWLMIQGGLVLLAGILILCMCLSAIEGFFHLLGWIFKLGVSDANGE